MAGCNSGNLGESARTSTYADQGVTLHPAGAMGIPKGQDEIALLTQSANVGVGMLEWDTRSRRRYGGYTTVSGSREKVPMLRCTTVVAKTSDARSSRAEMCLTDCEHFSTDTRVVNRPHMCSVF